MTIELDVVIPVRDVDRYLGEALRSVREQRDIVCAVVVVDAGSVRPITLPDPFRDDSSVRLVRSEVPLTAGAARNHGAELGGAPWISFLDADDLWPARSRRSLLDACDANGSEMAVGMMRTFHADEAARRLVAPEGVRAAQIAGGTVLSRECWNRVGPFDPTLRSGEIIDWSLRARLKHVRFAAIPDIVIERRVHLESTTANQIGDRNDYLTVVRQWMSRNG